MTSAQTEHKLRAFKQRLEEATRDSDWLQAIRSGRESVPELDLLPTEPAWLVYPGGSDTWVKSINVVPVEIAGQYWTPPHWEPVGEEFKEDNPDSKYRGSQMNGSWIRAWDDHTTTRLLYFDEAEAIRAALPAYQSRAVRAPRPRMALRARLAALEKKP